MHVFTAGDENSPKLVLMSGSGTVSPVYDFKILYEKLISKKTGSAKYVTYTFNNACEVHMSQKIVNTNLYHNKQLRASKSGDLFSGSWEDRDGDKYLVKGNIKAFHTFAEKNGKIYYFDWKGRRRTGFVLFKGQRGTDAHRL